MWEWANDPAVRVVSFQPAPIPWEDHVAWFEAHVAAPDCCMYIVEDENTCPIGQVRFETRDGQAEVSISLAADARGQGIGPDALRVSCRLFRQQSDALIMARVRSENMPSQRLFEKAGFVRRGFETVAAYPSIRFELVSAS